MLHERLCLNARNTDLNVIVDGLTISLQRKYKYLGLVIDELSFSDHVYHAKRQVTPFISLMRRKGKYIPVEKRRQLYFVLVQNHFTYMLPSWKYSLCFSERNLCSNKKKAIASPITTSMLVKELNESLNQLGLRNHITLS